MSVHDKPTEYLSGSLTCAANCFLITRDDRLQREFLRQLRNNAGMQLIDFSEDALVIVAKNIVMVAENYIPSTEVTPTPRMAHPTKVPL